jgi:chitinase
VPRSGRSSATSDRSCLISCPVDLEVTEAVGGTRRAAQCRERGREGDKPAGYAYSRIFTAIGGGGGTATGPVTGYGGLCVDVRGASTANFTPVQVYTCNGTAAQQWTVAGGTLQALGKCLDINGGGTSNGTTVDLYDCNGTGAQVWQPQAGGALENPQSGKYLDDTNWSTTPGTQLQIWSCTGGANQAWTLP